MDKRKVTGTKAAAAVQFAEDPPKTRGRGRPPGAEQGKLPGMEHSEDKALIKAAIKYRNSRDERVVAGRFELEDREALIVLMRDRGQTVYEHDGLRIEIVAGKMKVKVRTADDEEESEEDEG